LSAQCNVFALFWSESWKRVDLIRRDSIIIFDQIQGFLNFASSISLKRKGAETAKETLCCQQSQLKKKLKKAKRSATFTSYQSRTEPLV